MNDIFKYDEIAEIFIENYAEKYGIDKLRLVAEKIFTSKSIANLIQFSKISQVAISEKDIFEYLNSMGYFMFSKPDTQALGALLSLQRWNSEINFHGQFYNEADLSMLAKSIITTSKASINISNKRNDIVGNKNSDHHNVEDVSNIIRLNKCLEEAFYCKINNDKINENRFLKEALTFDPSLEEQVEIYCRLAIIDNFSLHFGKTMELLPSINLELFSGYEELKIVVKEYLKHAAFSGIKIDDFEVINKSYKILQKGLTPNSFFEVIESFMAALNNITDIMFKDYQATFNALTEDEKKDFNPQFLEYAFDRTKYELVIQQKYKAMRDEWRRAVRLDIALNKTPDVNLDSKNEL